jgi:hypothetical protein
MIAGLVLFTVVGAVYAQEPAGIMTAGVMTQAVKVVNGGNFGFVSDMLIGGSPVKGSPYSAEAVTETTQTLADGNRIVHKSTAMLYRDSSGRERREQSLPMIGPFTAQGDAPQIISISDPVAGVNYSLNSKERVAVKLPSAPALPVPPPGIGTRETFNVMVNGPAMGVAVGGPVMIYKSDSSSERVAPKVEQLGWKLIEGLQAEGTRSTITIAAGEVGNERPIEIVDEQWRSSDLQMIILSKHSDPRMGETMYSLTNVNRTEPSPALFQVPPDYTIQDKGPLDVKIERKIVR